MEYLQYLNLLGYFVLDIKYYSEEFANSVPYRVAYFALIQWCSSR